jgi:hypothetical protein
VVLADNFLSALFFETSQRERATRQHRRKIKKHQRKPCLCEYERARHVSPHFPFFWELVRARHNGVAVCFNNSPIKSGVFFSSPG